jgi:putative membrane protein insertion efficiency factor
MQTSYNFYQLFFQPQLGYSCKFHPSCSSYTKQAFSEHNLLKAFGLTLWRVLRCHPFSRGGVDPLPSKVVEPYGR